MHGPGLEKRRASDPLKRRAPQSALGRALRDQFARNLRHFRMKRGMTQLELASAAGVGRSFISQVERGHFSVTLETIAALAAALGIPPTKLIQTSD
jgi:DNA-binding XRE family transcriptional regulator